MFWQIGGSEGYHHVAGDGAAFYILIDRVFNFFKPSSRNSAGAKSVDYWRNEMKEMFEASNRATLAAIEIHQENNTRLLSELVESQRELNKALTEYIAFERGRREAFQERSH